MAAPTKKAERFPVIRTLSQDGFGRVDLATDLQTQSHVTVRHLSGSLFESPADAQQFVQRVKAATAIKRDGFQKILALGLAAGEPWIVCNGSDQGTLQDAIVEHRLEPRSLVSQFAAIAGRLDQLHGQGLVHGDLRPETLYYDRDGTLLAGDCVTLQALFQWRPGSAELPPGALDSLIHPAAVAPEVASGGRIDARADQYALARTMKLALASAYGGENRIPAAVAAALVAGMHAHPPERFSSCSAFVKAVENGLGSASAAVWQKMALVGVPVAAMIVAYVAGLSLGKSTWASEASARQKKQIDDYLQPFNAAPPKVESLPRHPRLPSADDRTASVADSFVNQRISKKERERLDQLRQLENLSRLKLDLDFSAKPALTPEAHAPVAILVPSFGPPRMGDAAAAVDYTLKVQSPAIADPAVEFRLVLRFPETPGVPDQVLKFDVRQSEQQFQGKIAPPGGNWKPGTTLAVDALISMEGKETPWRRFDRPAVATFDWNSTAVKVAPEMVKANQAAGFAIPSDLELVEGDFFKAAASGKIQPATEANYKILGLDPADSGPEGVEIKTEKSVRNYEIVNNKLPWAALLVKFGTKGDWLSLPATTTLFADPKKTGGKIFLSINSVVSQGGKPLPAGDNRWWQPKGGFDVTLARGRLDAPLDSPLLASARPRLQRRLGLLVGAIGDSALPAPASLTGAWETADGTKIDVVDTVSEVRMALSGSPHFLSYDFQFQRDQDDWTQRKGSVSFQANKGTQAYETDSQLLMIDADHLTMVNEEFHFENSALARRQPGGAQLQFTRIKEKPKNPSRSKPKDEPEGLLALNFSGIWRAVDQSTTFSLKDDGKQIKMTMLQSDRFKNFTGTIDKAEDKFVVASWRVTRAATATTLEQSFPLKCRISLKDPNTLIVEMDGLKFNALTGELEETVDYGIRSVWNRQSNFQTPFRPQPGFNP